MGHRAGPLHGIAQTQPGRQIVQRASLRAITNDEQFQSTIGQLRTQRREGTQQGVDAVFVVQRLDGADGHALPRLGSWRKQHRVHAEGRHGNLACTGPDSSHTCSAMAWLVEASASAKRRLRRTSQPFSAFSSGKS